MYKLSFKARHDCYETRLTVKFPKHHITVVDIQSRNPRLKQYLYYINGDPKKFDKIVSYLKRSKGYKLAREIERSKDTLLLLVVLFQKSYIQNIIQRHNGFFIELHTCYEGWENWHVGVVSRKVIGLILNELKKTCEIKVLHIGQAAFANALLSGQQQKVFDYAHAQGYYELPRKATIADIARALKLSHSTAGEHLLKAENKIINSMARRL